MVPLVEEDQDTAARSADEVAAALPAQLAEAASRAGLPVEPAARVGVVHGQMKAAARDATMDLFRRGELDVLVGTTVLEVGVDVPEATVMLILDADRFGLAQLHQLRGRVGRGEAQSYCILVSDSLTRPPGPGSMRWRRTTTASSWPSWTSSCAARANCSA